MYDPDLHLFLDDQGLHHCQRVGRILNDAKRLPRPVIDADKPWEEGCAITAWGNVLRKADGRLRM